MPVARKRVAKLNLRGRGVNTFVTDINTGNKYIVNPKIKKVSHQSIWHWITGRMEVVFFDGSPIKNEEKY